MNMRVQGSKDVKLIECCNPKYNKYIIRWDIKPFFQINEISGEEEECGVDYFEYWINHKPSIDEVKNIILAQINNEIDEKIISGFVWKDMEIWLSTENQFNYKAAYDLAIQTEGATLPVMFKFGTSESPIYYTFTDVTDLTDFYIQAMNYINIQLSEGWKRKDSLDWSEYIKLLNEEKGEE